MDKIHKDLDYNFRRSRLAMKLTGIRAPFPFGSFFVKSNNHFLQEEDRLHAIPCAERDCLTRHTI
jgi:hypothetical protein